MAGSEQQTPAVVLRTTAVGEADLMLSVLTPMRGRLELRACGARKSRRRFPGGLPVGARGNATIAGRGARAPGQVGRLLSFEPRADNAAIGRDLESFAYTAYLCELSDRLVSGTQADPAVFAALVEALASALREPAPVVLRSFELRLLETLGHLPVLDRCCVCGSTQLAKTAEAYAFDLARGGTLCIQHAAPGDLGGGPARPGGEGGLHLGSGGLPIGVVETALALARGTEGPEAREREAALSVGERRALRDLTLRVVRGHLRRPLRSAALFGQLTSAARGTMDRGDDEPGP